MGKQDAIFAMNSLSLIFLGNLQLLPPLSSYNYSSLFRFPTLPFITSLHKDRPPLKLNSFLAFLQDHKFLYQSVHHICKGGLFSVYFKDCYPSRFSMTSFRCFILPKHLFKPSKPSSVILSHLFVIRFSYFLCSDNYQLKLKLTVSRY